MAVTLVLFSKLGHNMQQNLPRCDLKCHGCFPPKELASFLVKLALLNAQALGDASAFETRIAAALRDL